MSNGRLLRSKYEPFEPPLDTFHGYLLKRAAEHGARTFLVEYETGKEYSYAQFVSDCQKLGKALKQAGLKVGDVFISYGYNSYELYVTLVAGLSIGGVALAVRGQDSLYEVEKEIVTRNAKVVFVDHGRLDVAKKLATRGDIKVFLFNSTSNGDNIATVSRMIAEAEDGLTEADYYQADASKTVAIILESSGTTGPSKGSLLSHRSMVALVTTPCVFTQVRSSDSVICPSPPAHVMGIAAFASTLIQGGRLVTLKTQTTEKVVSVIEQYKINVMYRTPPELTLLTKYEKPADLSSLRIVTSAGVRLPPAVAKAFLARYNVENFIHMFGMTEMGSLVTQTDGPQKTYESVGKLMPNVELKVVDLKTREPLGPNEEGELLVRTPFRFLGYFNEPERTKQTLDIDGFIHTGDIGYYDEDENVYLVERIKDIIDQRGYGFSPVDLEDVMLQHEAVLEACALGLPHEKFGELAHAFVVLKHGYQLTEDQLKEFVNSRISELKRLESVHFVSELPKTGLGKIQKRLIKENYLKSLDAPGQ